MIEVDVVAGEFCEGSGDVCGKILEERREGGDGEGFFFDGRWDVGGELCVGFGLEFWLDGGGGGGES